MFAPFMTAAMMIAMAVHIAVMVMQEKDVADREREHALFAHREVCDNNSLMGQLGRFHRCDEIHEVLSVDNLWLLASDRAMSRFLHALKQQTFDDIAHVGLFALIALLGFSLVLWILGIAMRSWGTHAALQRSKTYESPSLNKKGQVALNIK